jgi:DNA-directed RNA polymerase subunit M/transcription elongation factor TFIIS
MKFCSVCDNMLYLSLDDTDKLTFRCKNCLNEEDAPKEACILNKNYIDDETKYQQYINPNIKYDATLPRVNAIRCPNAQCSKPSDKDNEVIYLKYDKTNMRFMYYCCFCETFWKSK